MPRLVLALAAALGLAGPAIAADLAVSPEQATALGIETQPAAPATVLVVAATPARWWSPSAGW
jgi:hypothetical protein